MTYLIILLSFVFLIQSQNAPYLWHSGSIMRTVESIQPPKGFDRDPVKQNSFEQWLRNLPLKPDGAPVRLHTAEPKPNQDVHHSVIDIDVGKQNLQQCADALIRLRSEYLYAMEKYKEIHFNFTSGDNASFMDWCNGKRPKVNGNNVSWRNTGKRGISYSQFRSYLKTVFMYAGTFSLKKELKKQTDITIGAVFIEGGFPGHAMIVVDLVKNKQSGEIAVLLAQSYMPAQNIHIVKNYTNEQLTPWFKVETDGKLITPEWTFDWSVKYTFE